AVFQELSNQDHHPRPAQPAHTQPLTHHSPRHPLIAVLPAPPAAPVTLLHTTQQFPAEHRPARTMKQAAHIIKAVLAVCIGPLLLAPTVSARTSSAFADAENSFYDYSGDEFERVKNFDFNQCDYNTWMCCWDGRNGLAVKDNTDVCSYRGEEFPGDSEGPVHCHGFVWPENASDDFIKYLALDVAFINHVDEKAYTGNIPGAPVCHCLEEMPEVSRADCTQYRTADLAGSDFMACSKNDLRRAYKELYPTGRGRDLLVKKCDNRYGM
ncbi:unnamed protein product, partial [Ectocarpus sp. 6 AP-2014]